MQPCTVSWMACYMRKKTVVLEFNLVGIVKCVQYGTNVSYIVYTCNLGYCVSQTTAEIAPVCSKQAMGWMTLELGFDSLQEQEFYPILTVFMGPNYPPIQWVAGSFSQGIKGAGLYLDPSIPSHIFMAWLLVMHRNVMLHFKIPHLCHSVKSRKGTTWNKIRCNNHVTT
jgi:hypothetical protein